MALQRPRANDLEISTVDLFIQTIRKVLTSRSTETTLHDGKGLKHSAVLIPLVLEDDVWKVLFTRRSRQVPHHKGQISFPGGKLEPKDRSYQETALREAFEEIGLLREQIEVLGRIDDIQTVASRFIVHPFVGHILEVKEFNVNPSEVESIIKIPFTHFLKVDSYKEKHAVAYDGKIYETPAYRYHKDQIWGATAGMMKNLVDIIGSKIDLLREKK